MCIPIALLTSVQKKIKHLGLEAWAFKKKKKNGFLGQTLLLWCKSKNALSKGGHIPMYLQIGY